MMCAMRDKIGPWQSAKFCAFLSLMTLAANVAGRFVGASAEVGAMAFYGFIPVCFFMVGVCLSQLKKENQALREQVKELSKPSVGTTAA